MKQLLLLSNSDWLIIHTTFIELGDETKDGERIACAAKDLGSCEVYPQSLQHSPNGRFVVVCGDGEYIIYTALAWRNKSFGSGLEFVWALDSNEYAVRESTNKIKLFKNFKEKPNLIRLNYSAEGIFGGTLLGVKSASFLNLYDWDTGATVRRIDCEPQNVSLCRLATRCDLCSSCAKVNSRHLCRYFLNWSIIGLLVRDW